MRGFTGFRLRAVCAVAMAVLLAPAGARAAMSLENGGFENGLAKWTTVAAVGGSGWYAYSGTTAPMSGNPIPAPTTGTFAAVSDQISASKEILFRDIALEQATSYDLLMDVFYVNRHTAFVAPASMCTCVNNQQFRIDIVKPSPNLETLAAADLLKTVFVSTPETALEMEPTQFRVDLTAFRGTTVRLRFAVIATNAPINAGVDDVRLVTNDVVPPTAAITSGPPNPTASGNSTFSFTGTDNVTPTNLLRFQCRVDEGQFASCTSPTQAIGLTEGPHVFEVRALDGADNLGLEPARYVWSIDRTPPNTSIAKGPGSATRASSATFYLDGTDNVSSSSALSYQCSIDGGAFAACVTPASFYGFGEGTHTFRARALDQAGNMDPTPVEHTWAVDLTEPGSGFTTPDGSIMRSMPLVGDFVRGISTDTLSGVAKVTLTFHDATDAYRYVQATLSCNTTKRTCGWWASPPVYPGVYQVTVLATDAVGNVETGGPPPITIVVA